MTPLSESLLESVAAAAVREGLADAIFTRLNTPLGRLLVVQGPDGPRPDRLRRASPRTACSPRSRPRSGPNVIGSDRELADRARRAVGVPRGRRDDARRCPSTCGSRTRRSGARCWRSCARSRAGQTVSYGELAARAGNPKAARAVGTACARNPIPIVVPCHRVLPEHGQARQLRRRPGAQARAARRSRALLLADGDRLDDDLGGGLARVRVGLDAADLVDDLHALGDLAQQRVVGRQRRGAVAGDDEELRARRARRLVARSWPSRRCPSCT